MQQMESVPRGLGEDLAFDEEASFVRSKTSLRMHYEAQVEVIQKQVGDLEKIRHELGLSNRKISQLLMIDPSSWTRWTRQGDKAPPHIWRALQWYLILREKIPGLTPQYFVGQDPRTLHQKALGRIDEERQERLRTESFLRAKIQQLDQKMKIYRLLLGTFVGTSLILSLLLLLKL